MNQATPLLGISFSFLLRGDLINTCAK